MSILPYSRPRNSKIIKSFTYSLSDLDSDCDVTIPVTCRISSNTDATDSILHGVDSTVFEVGELKYKDLAKD